MFRRHGAHHRQEQQRERPDPAGREEFHLLLSLLESPVGTSLSALLRVDICLQRDGGPSQSVFLVPAALSTSSKAFLRRPLSRVLLSPVSDIRLRTPVHNWHHFFSGPAGLYMPWTRICQRNTFRLRGSFTLKSVFPSGLSLC